MDMASIDIDISDKKKRNTDKQLIYLIVFLALCSDEAFAFEWSVSPTLTLTETYSDNIRQTSEDQRSALVTEVSPGISARSMTGINFFNLDYRMQNLYNAGGDSNFDINNQLRYNSKTQLLRNSLYLDSSSSISQQNISNRNITRDNLTGSSNSSTVTTFRISPYWTPHLQNYADGQVRVSYDRISSSGGNSTLSDTNSFSQTVQLNSGNYFSRFSWSAAFNNRESYYSDGDDVKFQNSSGEIRTYLNRDFSLFARAGHSNNQFQTTTDSNNNGFFYTAGAQWRPSARFSVEAGYGNNMFVTVNISPIQRLNWSTTYSNNDIGTNTGDRWQSSLRYNRRNSTWGFNYSEDTLTTQQVLLARQSGTFEQLFGLSYDDFFNQTTGATTADRLGQFLGIPATEVSPQLISIVDNRLDDFIFETDLPSFTDEVFISKRGDLTAAYYTGKSVFNANGFWERREFEVSQNKEEVYGVRGSWNWNFARMTSSQVSLLWQTTNGQDSTSDDLFEATVGVNRNIFSYLNGRVEYRFLNQQSDLSDNTFSENRISASLFMRF